MRKNQGITLIALIITIIVMLILVGVVVTVVIQSDLLGTAKTAGDKYKIAYEEESNMSGVTINGKQYGSIEEYMEEINPTIVEGNIEDWGYTEEDDGTITITKYLNTDTTIDTVVIPNYIDGKPVKTVKGERNYPTNTNRYRSIWNDALLAENSEWIGMYNYRNFETYKNTTIKKVVISEGIETIETGAFSGSTSLTQIKLPETLKKIGEASFAACVSLQKITIPNNVTSVAWWIFIGEDINITVNVPWKENEKPDGWDEDWNYVYSDVVTTVCGK